MKPKLFVYTSIYFLLLLGGCTKSAEQLYSEGSETRSNPEKALALFLKSCDKGYWLGCKAAWDIEKNKPGSVFEEKFYSAAEIACLGEQRMGGKKTAMDLIPVGISMDACEAYAKNHQPIPSLASDASYTLGQIMATLCLQKNDISACMDSGTRYYSNAIDLKADYIRKPAVKLYAAACKGGNGNGCLQAALNSADLYIHTDTEFKEIPSQLKQAEKLLAQTCKNEKKECAELAFYTSAKNYVTKRLATDPYINGETEAMVVDCTKMNGNRIDGPMKACGYATLLGKWLRKFGETGRADRSNAVKEITSN